MNFPIPKPPTKMLSVKPVETTDEAPKIKKLATYICTLPNGKEVEVRADDPMEVVTACMKRYRQKPTSFIKKPFVQTDRMSVRPLLKNDELINLKKQLSRNGAK